jgi:hypothetical protein
MTCSAGCCTSTGELHERIYAPYELQLMVDDTLDGDWIYRSLTRSHGHGGPAHPEAPRLAR